MSSENILGMVEPYDYQCEYIDAMINSCNEAITLQTAAVLAHEKQTVIQANLESLRRIEHFPEQLEEFRTAIECVREWGEQWKKLAKGLLNEYEPERLNPKPEYCDDIPF
ncbi:MAG: hypothetical protein ACRC47_13900 [Shewanella sp.]